jgi:hypothetical protein
LERKYQKVSNVKTLPDSASHTMWLLFEALNTLGEEFDVIIDNLAVYADSATFTGSVPNMEQLEILRKAIDEEKFQLRIASINYDLTGSGAAGDPLSRRAFTMQIEVNNPTAEHPRKGRR